MRRNKVCLRVEEGSILADLGWTDEDLIEIKKSIIGCRMHHNLPLTPSQVVEYITLQTRYDR